MEPITNGGNGRELTGRFAKGNPGGPGNPFTRQVATLRGQLLKSVKRNDLRDIVAALVEKSKAGDIPAIKLLFAYLIGAPRLVEDNPSANEDVTISMRIPGVNCE